MKRIKKGIWKGWKLTDNGFQRNFGKIVVFNEQGFFYTMDEDWNAQRFLTLKEALDAQSH